MGPDVEYTRNAPLTQLLESVERPRDFCTDGRMFLPMPTIEVVDLGLLSFPVPESQVRALIGVAERAPYGKNADNAVGRVLVAAARRAECAVHAVIVHVQEQGEAAYAGGGYVESWHWRETERRGRPYTLVCTKNRASHERRLAEYADDVAAMQSLLQSKPGGEWAAPCAAPTARLHQAVAER